ncbi:hypothetical protein PYCCODRAFT_1465456 [Trametes coccinea BRFM310]|uniref:Uncharacterized protein n=1 Tax=Trametes coccinea (strain BRFM310) TaxID=1353009 RepID=A0A1Y2IV66_TRAC3|nr:hypothetical protein PYCCODRAFT_1465456 [Trametes coccinea BRFM310]
MSCMAKLSSPSWSPHLLLISLPPPIFILQLSSDNQHSTVTMPVRRPRSASTDICQVVPADGELPCTQPGYGGRPRLCNVHRKEYGRLTSTYKHTSLEAEACFVEVCARETSVDVSDARAVQDARKLVRMCVEMIDREIRERQEHHRRFFVELDDRHGEWIEVLRQRRQTVKDTASNLRVARKRKVKADRRQADRERSTPSPSQRTSDSSQPINIRSPVIPPSRTPSDSL